MSHSTEKVLSNKQSRPAIVVVGGGFAGTKLVKTLEKLIPKTWDIFLLSEDNYVTFNPLLPEVIGADLLPAHVLAPIRLMINRTRVRMVRVDRIDVKEKCIYYHGNEPGTVYYDHLVMAAGVRANVDMLPGMSQFGLPLKTVGDALYIRNRIITQLESATIQPNQEERKRLVTFLVVGGGFSGVEVAGELCDFIIAAERYFKNVKADECKVIVVHGEDRLLPELSEPLGKKVFEIFNRRGIEVHLNKWVKEINKNSVLLDCGRVIEAGTIICTLGTKPSAFFNDTELPTERGKVIAQQDMSVKGEEGVWAIGDCALITNTYNQQHCPPTAQFAEQQAVQLAKNIQSSILGKPTQPFYYKPKGMLASIGHNKAVAEIYGIRISGFIAWLMWRAIYLLKMPTFSRKVRLFLEWSWAMFFPPDISHLGFQRSKDFEKNSDTKKPEDTL
ncbi:MAG: NAD(P)/FAD-dependent oxidoreductase [Pseudomonadota bacterium]